MGGFLCNLNSFHENDEGLLLDVLRAEHDVSAGSFEFDGNL